MATDVTSSDTAAAANGLPLGTDLVRLKDIASDLRCLVCQNQTIADSNAGLAVDLRNQVAKLMSQGKTDTEIKQYMVDRYGEFVLYDPPFSVSNALLWVGPFILVVAGVWITRRMIAARAQTPDVPELSEAQRAAVEARYRQGQ